MIVPKNFNPYAGGGNNSMMGDIHLTHYTVLNGKIIQKDVSKQQFKADTNRQRALGVL